MRRAQLIYTCLLILALTSPSLGEGTSVGFSVGGGLPTGWWADRWGLFSSGEIDLRYRFAENTGFFLATGLDKTYLTDLSSEEIAQESRFRDVHNSYKPYTKIEQAVQDGSFKQLPISYGFFQEMDIAGYRAYGSLGMVVHLWRFERGQRFRETVTPPTGDTLVHIDNWWDVQDGSNVGFQLGGGLLYPLKKNLLLDVSAIYHFVGIDKKYAAIAYWGYPARARDWRPEVKETAETGVNYLVLRLGVRFGL